MIFLYNLEAGKKELGVFGNDFIHIFKSRRSEIGQIIKLRNLKDPFDYFYQIEKIEKKKAVLKLTGKERLKNKKQKKLHLGWAMIDPSSIKEALPYLNQIGVDKITFIKTARSQKTFNLKKEKIEKILIRSSEQCGRNDLMKISFSNSLSDFLKKYPESFLLDFGGKEIKSKNKIETVIIGPEGGFDSKELELFKEEKILSFKTDNILKSENAAITISAKLIL